MDVLLYRSRARPGLSAGDLNDIIEVAQRHNARSGLTGLLVYGDMKLIPGAPGEFVQWIEGDGDAIEAVMASIRDDPRHEGVDVLAQGEVREVTSGRYTDRVFPSWSMGLVRLSELPATLSGFLEFLAGWGETLTAAEGDTHP